MIFFSLILLLGVCSPRWTTATLYSFHNYILDIDNETLKSVDVTSPYQSGTIDLSSVVIQSFEKNVFDNLTNVRKIVLSGNGIERLPPLVFSKLIDLEELSLANNDIEKLPQQIFSKLNNLKELSLANNPIKDIHGLFVGMKNLKRLDLSNNPIFELKRGDLFGLTKSGNIILSGNRLELLYSGVFQNPFVSTRKFDDKYQSYWEYSDEDTMSATPLPNNFEVKICKSHDGVVISVEELKKFQVIGLNCIQAKVDREKRVLDFSGLDLSKFQSGWYKLQPNTIRKIDLSVNNIVNITRELLNNLPAGLSVVDLTYNGIEIIEKNIIDNRNIQKIIFDYNSIATIEDGAFEKTKLRTLNVGKNNLDSLAFVRTLPKSIEVLRLLNNRLLEIPVDTFRGLKKLRMIDLSDNYLRKIEPGTFQDQTNLLELRFVYNNISEVNSGIFKGLKMIKLLDFSHNKIKKLIRNTFSELRNSRDLEIYFHDNEIDFIDGGSLSNLNLILLDLTVNKITDKSIAMDAFNGCKVQRLALGSNYITKLNSELFKGISGAWELNLYGNQIRTIRKGAAKYLSNVSGLILDHNPLDRLENGALYGLSKDKDVKISLYTVPITVIQGGLFDDV